MNLEGSLSVEQFYAEAKSTGKLLGLVCESGHITVPPRHTCRVCGSMKLTKREISRYGTVVSYTTVHTKSRAFPLDVPYNLALVSLDEGGNLLGVIEESDSGPDITSSSRARVFFKTLSRDPIGRPRIFFEIV